MVITIICSLSINVSAVIPSEDAAVNDKLLYEMSEGLVLNRNLSTNEQLKIVANSNALSERQKKLAVEKINFTNKVNLMALKQIGTMDTTTYNCTVAIPYFKQVNEYYCGPATTQQSIHYILGMSHHQEEIAEALGTTTAGTDGSRIVWYMNQNQDKVYYMAVYPYSEPEMAKLIYRGLTEYKTAPILRLKMIESQGWHYKSDGHFMNISGEYTVNGATQYEVTDPYIQYKDETKVTGKYRISSLAVYESSMNHFAQEFYY